MTYIVTITPKHHVAGTINTQIEIEAKNVKAAISEARRQMRNACTFDHHDGEVFYYATRA